MSKTPLTYKDSGVDIDAQDRALDRVKGFARRTFTPGVLADIGSFGGLFDPSASGHAGQVLVSSADGAGTKLKVAQMAGRYDTVGQDLVNHCVNDILVQGAVPLFFMDYLAAGVLVPERVAAVVEGLCIACEENGMALLGGETAEMPGLYHGEDFDLAGFIVGAVERDAVLPGGVEEGQVLLGLPSTGLHTNGYSLARRLFFEEKGFSVDARLADLDEPLGDALLAIHRSYLKPVSALMAKGLVPRAMAHITGGGLPDNLPRVLPEGVHATVRRDAWVEPALFRYIRREGRVPDDDMARTFNLGIGMVLILPPESLDATVEVLEAMEEHAIVIGELERGRRGCTLV